jgi:hypothetical protein
MNRLPRPYEEDQAAAAIVTIPMIITAIPKMAIAILETRRSLSEDLSVFNPRSMSMNESANQLRPQIIKAPEMKHIAAIK